MACLVDLSLFAVSPADDGHFALSDDHASPSLYGTSPSTLLARSTATMKPLPPLPERRRPAAARRDPRTLNPSRCLLDRMKRLRLDTTVATSAGSLANPRTTQHTIQQRRRRGHTEAATPSLTIPTSHPQRRHDHRRTAPGPVTESARAGPPMIWLADEQMWLVADGTDQGTERGNGQGVEQGNGVGRELYGFYAPAPHSDPGPWQEYQPPLHGFALESPPAYSQASSASPPDPSDLSPVRTQFLNLMEARRRDNESRTATVAAAAAAVHASITTLEAGRPLRDDRAMSPLFQEAMSGVGFGPFGAEDVQMEPARSENTRHRWAERVGSVNSDGCVSPLSPDPDLRLPWKVKRASSSRV